MKAGLSKPWRETLFEAIGTSELDSSAVIDYFKPLQDYLNEQLKKSNEAIGWVSKYQDFYVNGERYPQLNTNEDEATQFLNDLDPVYLKEANTQMKTRWQSITDITEEHSQAEVSPFQLLLRRLEAFNGFLNNIDIACR